MLMPTVAEVYHDVNGNLQAVAQCEFEVPPQAGDQVDLPPNIRAQVVRAEHVPVQTPPGQPLRMQYKVIVK
jgi:hypothetical protein